MAFTYLDSSIAEKSAEEPWFYMEQAVRQYAQNTIPKDLRNLQEVSNFSFSLSRETSLTFLSSRHQDDRSDPFELLPSNFLPTSAPHFLVENTTPDDQRAGLINSETEDAGESCDALSDWPFDGDDSIIEIEVFDSSTSSRVMGSLSRYSSESEDTNSNGSESNFDSLFDDYSTEDFTICQNGELPSIVVSAPSSTAAVQSEERLRKPVSLESRSWTEHAFHLPNDNERHDHINVEVAEEFERELRFKPGFLSSDEAIRKSTDVIDCDEEEVEGINLGDVMILSQRSLEEGDAEPPLNLLLNLGVEDSMMQLDKSAEDEQALGDSSNASHDLNFIDQERREKQLLVAYRYSRAIQLNPHLAHLFV
ncbi:uncharacterized protein MELLADRAFT_69011 [Melampsora larici-populina 98AG31]|uniref:Uncharacterized protein n=1 Tax=Melampsora larici-populina (strain 98AG31 / pathotype 3-4-7) TaxID=747676 RepID=F4S937_MELLP|nr:uncharacterized protein MELLADRAFT_69011 [Melampsora larici-populina 98AG31]EGF98853.1 hypothetical protein MELLADRAFT_69011 [Melampsora larici-populina 98AG31]